MLWKQSASPSLSQSQCEIQSGSLGKSQLSCKSCWSWGGMLPTDCTVPWKQGTAGMKRASLLHFRVLNIKPLDPFHSRMELGSGSLQGNSPAHSHHHQEQRQGSALTGLSSLHSPAMCFSLTALATRAPWAACHGLCAVPHRSSASCAQESSPAVHCSCLPPHQQALETRQKGSPRGVKCSTEKRVLGSFNHVNSAIPIPLTGCWRLN